MKYFIAGSTARTAADLAGIHRNTAVRFFHKLRCSIAVKQQERAEQFAGEIELDESYFGGHSKGMRGRGASQVKLLSLVFLSEVVKFIHKSSWMLKQIRLCL